MKKLGFGLTRLPLINDEFAFVQKAAEIINKSVIIPCTGCSYCINNCPLNIAIPKYFSLYNADMQELEAKTWTAQTIAYGHLAEQFGKASACIGCKQCEKMCPQHLPITQLLKQVTKRIQVTQQKLPLPDRICAGKARSMENGCDPLCKNHNQQIHDTCQNQYRTLGISQHFFNLYTVSFSIKPADQRLRPLCNSCIDRNNDKRNICSHLRIFIQIPVLIR